MIDMYRNVFSLTSCCNRWTPDLNFLVSYIILLYCEGKRPRSEGGQEMSIPVESTAASRGGTLPVTARPPKCPETVHSHKYVFALASCLIYAWALQAHPYNR